MNDTTGAIARVVWWSLVILALCAVPAGIVGAISRIESEIRRNEVKLMEANHWFPRSGNCWSFGHSVSGGLVVVPEGRTCWDRDLTIMITNRAGQLVIWNYRPTADRDSLNVVGSEATARRVLKQWREAAKRGWK